MNVTLPIPDELARRLGSGEVLACRALEAFAAEEYRAGRLNIPELRDLLGFATGAELQAFLSARGMSLKSTDQHQQQSAPPIVARMRAFRAGKELKGLDPAALIRDGRR